ncbi:hypothetical protein G3N57_04055 [Paraburkholderia sp. Se-20369]|nr:hypothetical protein [Paraburkholderia sp. Se-20369]
MRRSHERAAPHGTPFRAGAIRTARRACAGMRSGIDFNPFILATWPPQIVAVDRFVRNAPRRMRRASRENERWRGHAR